METRVTRETGFWVFLWQTIFIMRIDMGRLILTLEGTILHTGHPELYKMGKPRWTTAFIALCFLTVCNVTSCLKLLPLWLLYHDRLSPGTTSQNKLILLNLFFPPGYFIIAIGKETKTKTFFFLFLILNVERTPSSLSRPSSQCPLSPRSTLPLDHFRKEKTS